VTHRIFLAATVILLLLPGGNGSAESAFDQETCSLCHIRESVFFNPSFLTQESLRDFDEARLCGSCHNGSVQDSRAQLWRGAQHPSVGGAKGRKCSPCHSPHSKGGWSVLAGTAVSLRRGGDSVCAGCHASHSGSEGIHRGRFSDGGCRECHQAHGGSGKALLRDSGTGLCLRCHGGKTGAGTEGHPTAGFPSEPGSGEGARMPGCLGCHPAHRPGETGSVINGQCAACHPFGKGKEGRTGAGHRGEENCTSCHAFHARSTEGGKGFRGRDIRTDTLCCNCHPAYWAGDVKSGRAAGTHVTYSGAEKVEICGRCHRVHDAAPGTPLLRSAKAYSCLECHEGQNTIREAGGIVLAHPVFEKVARGRLTAVAREKRLVVGPAGEIVCATCHKVHGARAGTPLLAFGAERAESCFWCHEGMEGKSHRPNAPGARGDCVDCHPVHGRREAGGDPWSVLCQACHPRPSVHKAGKEDRVFDRKIDLPEFDPRGRKNTFGVISCPTCHQPHGGPAEPGRVRKNYRPNGFLCTTCHVREETVVLTPHDLRGIAGNSVCEPCHIPHKGTPPWMWGMRRGEGGSPEEVCLVCHGGKGMGTPVPKGGHPRNVMASRPLPERYPLIGADGVPARNGVVSCPTCHAVHGTGMFPAGKGAGKLLRVPPEGEPADMCDSCHQGKSVQHGRSNCIACHPPHAEESPEAVCVGCHRDRPGALFARHLEAGKGCVSCHGIHAGTGKENGAQRKNGAGTCYGCHPGARKIEGTFHAEIGTSTCAPCHPVHRDLPKADVRPKVGQEFFAPDLLCIRCHREGGDAPLPREATHPNRMQEVPTSYGAKVTLETPIVMMGRHMEGGRPLFPLFSEDGRQAMSGRMGCLTCHNPHAGAGGEVKNAYLRDPTMAFLSELCSQCHRDDGVKRVKEFHRIPRGAP